MSDILVTMSPYQASSSPTHALDFFLRERVTQSTSQACIVDLVAPLFSGIDSLSVQASGQFRVKWLVAIDPTLPIRYEVYIKAGTSTDLFNSSNIVTITDKLQADIFTTPDGEFLVYGDTYYVGVRATDGVGNRDSNTHSLSAVSPGMLVAGSSYSVQGAFSVDTENRLRGSLWGLKDSVLMTGVLLGQAKYQVYDKTGTAISGMGENSITADSNGLFIITPVASSLSSSLDHYTVQVQIAMDGALRTGNISIIEKAPQYEVGGVFSLNTSNQMQATFWASANDEMITTAARLGTASYQVYDKTGSLVAGMSQSGISADANGYYKITPVASLLETDLSHYVVKVSIVVDNIARTQTLPIMGKIPTYTIKGAFSLNTANKLCGTLWALRDSGLVTGSALGTASYQVYDRTGNAIGMSESGIVADGNGQFKITPAASLLDQNLNHYLIRVSITVDGATRSDYLSIIERIPQFDLDGVFAVDSTNKLTGSLWAIADGQAITDTARLGTARYQVYDKNGVLVSGMSETLIAPNMNGTFVITAVNSTLEQVLTYHTVYVAITVDGIERAKVLPIAGKYPSFEAKGIFSINASNLFQATLWATVDGIAPHFSSLGAARYQVYDASGSVIPGLGQTGLTADSLGRFSSTPMSASALTDLTHYTVLIGIVVNGVERVSYRGFTLLGN